MTGRVDLKRDRKRSGMRPIVFADGALSGVLSLPPGHSASLGLVVCAPLGHELSLSYRPLRTLAQRVADRGVPVLRFDWYGCGDSLDDPAETEGPEIWRGAISEAIETLQATTGIEEVALLGLRIGAIFAALEAASNPSISRLALLAPYVKGSSYLREVRAYEAIARQEGPENPLASLFTLPPGSLENLGYLISAPECTALRSLELSPASWAHVPARTLVVSTPDDQAAAVVAGQLTAAGSHVTEAHDGRLPAIWWTGMSPHMPWSTRDAVVNWLTDGLAPASAPLVVGRPIAATRLLEHVAVKEEAFTIQVDRGECMAIACTPASGTELDTWVVFLNTGPERRVGLHRLSTTWGREWASAGVPSLRLDAIGIGDSGGYETRDEHYSPETERFYGPEAVHNLLEFLDWLADNRGARRFAVIGLCSGATNAYELAVADPRVTAVGLLNPPFLFADTGVLRLLARQELQSIVKGPRGLVSYLLTRSPRRIARALRGSLLHRRGGTPASLHVDKVPDSLSSLTKRGCRITMICDDQDSSLTYLGETIGPDFRDQLETLGVELEILENIDHTFHPLWCHDLVRNPLERLLIEAGFLAGTALRSADAHDFGPA
jgi:pimeloyl-ACP methyl ester carboxylesterase